MKRVIVLTGSELRHQFVSRAIALDSEIEVVKTYCEGLEKSLKTVVQANSPDADFQLRHIEARESSEEDFFGALVRFAPDCSNSLGIKKGQINDESVQREIIELDPDLIIVYGSSIIKEPLLSTFDGRILNVHLGLSPYYRGSGTNFWALVNGEPEYVGATFMYLDAGVDTGKIIHQLRARVFAGDTPHQIGNRLICDMTAEYIKIIRSFENLSEMPTLSSDESKYYRQKDFTVESVKRLYENFQNGLVETYLSEAEMRAARAPIITNTNL